MEKIDEIIGQLRNNAMRFGGIYMDTYEWKAADLIVRLKTALHLIAIHPVEHSQEWKIGSKEMISLAKDTLEKLEK